MKTILTLALLCFFFLGFSQEQLVRLGTVQEINAKTEATNTNPLLVVQNVVYSIPIDCFCNRDSDDNTSNRNTGKDDSERGTDNRNANRNSDGDKLDRNSSGDKSGRNSGSDFIYRDGDGSGEGRNSGSDDSNRDSDAANAERNSAGDTDGRDSGNAANDRDASSDSLKRNFATTYISPSCSKKKDSCSIQILGFHPHAKMEYFDKIESIKAVDMTIKF